MTTLHDAPEYARDDRARDDDGRATAATAAAAAAAAADLGAVARRGVRCGLFAAAATAGAVAGVALRAGDALTAPFAVNGRMLLGVPASSGGAASQALAVAAGVLLHCALVVAWALPFAALVRRRRGAVALSVVAALYSAAAYLVSVRFLPTLLRLGHGARAFPPQVALLYFVLAFALAAGMRIAFSGNAEPPAASHS